MASRGDAHQPDGSNTQARARLVAVLAGLHVESNPRYRAGRQGRGDTYCNLFVADVTRALGVPIPQYLEAPDGARQYLNADAMQAWLFGAGRQHGWEQVTAEAAQQAANAGRAAVATWKNPEAENTGHMAMLRPGPLPVPAEHGPRIAQAGQRNINSGSVRDGFGNARLAEVIYFAQRG